MSKEIKPILHQYEIGLGADLEEARGALARHKAAGGKTIPLKEVEARLGLNNGVDYKPIDRAVLNGEEAAIYLGLSNRKGCQRLVDQGLLTPLTYGKSHIFSLVELKRFLEKELDNERMRRGLPGL